MKSSRTLVLLLAVIAVGVVVIAAVLIMLLTDDDEPEVVPTPTTSVAPMAEPYPLDSIDVESWHAELRTAGADLDIEAMPRLYELVADSCDDSLLEMTAAMSVPGVDPETSRIGYQYVCPSSLPRLEEAIFAAM